MMKNRKRKTFIFEGLGFPIKLMNAPMKKEFGEWCIDINMNKLMLVVLEALVHKPAPLTGGEIGFIRSYLRMTTTEFGKTFDVSHVAVLKWESGKNKIAPALDFYIRLYILENLKAKDKEFKLLYQELRLKQLAKTEKIVPISVEAADSEDLKIAL